MAKYQQRVNYYEVLTSDIFAIVIDSLETRDLLQMRATCRAWKTTPRLYARIRSMSPHYVFASLNRPVKSVLTNKLITSDVDIAWRDAKGRTLLHLCAQYQLKKKVKMLINGGADVNASDKYGLTPLMLTARFFPGRVDRMRSGRDVMIQLLAAGAMIDCTDTRGCTALFLAAKRNTKYAEFLMKSKANVHLANKKGQTPLMMAVRALRYGCACTLIEKFGADVHARDNRGWLTYWYLEEKFNAEDDYTNCRALSVQELLLQHKALRPRQ